MVTTNPNIDHTSLKDMPAVEIPFAVLHKVSWQTYQALLADMGEHRASRLAYSHGILEIKMPSKLHELINRLLERIITTLTEELSMSVLSLGSTTFDREKAGQGVEPDSCFYIQNAAYINPEDEQPPADLPPDLVVEVDITSSSRSRLNIYGNMGVPEIWRYNRQGFTVLCLREGAYAECASSLAFPKISAEFLSSLIEKGTSARNQNAVIRELRDSLQESTP
jgi:Uma2 family endonuclease